MLVEVLLSGSVFDNSVIPAKEIDLAHDAGGLFYFVFLFAEAYYL